MKITFHLLTLKLFQACMDFFSSAEDFFLRVGVAKQLMSPTSMGKKNNNTMKVNA